MLAHSRVVISSDARRPLLASAELWAYREVLYALVPWIYFTHVLTKSSGALNRHRGAPRN